jgi:dipicolinate synthase subunit A
MSLEFAIIGGDLRTVELSKMLVADGNTVYVYGLEKAEELKNNLDIIFLESLEDVIKRNIKIIIAPIPFSKDGININTPFSDKKISIKDLVDNLENRVLIAGSINKEINKEFQNKNIEIIDVMKKEELAILNTISTAEGTIEVAIKNTNRILHGSEVLILGFGRIGKTLAKKMEGLSAKVTCAARKNEDLAWIRAYGYMGIDINLLTDKLSKYDIIINTVPDLIITSKEIEYLKKECLLIDLASAPRRNR